MALKLTVDIVDTDKQTVAEVLELIAQQVSQGFFSGFDETTKEIDGISVSCNYSYKLADI